MTAEYEGSSSAFHVATTRPIVVSDATTHIQPMIPA